MTFKEEKLYHLKTCLVGRNGFTSKTGQASVIESE